MPELLFKDEVYAIVGVAMEVYNQPGPGFLVPHYQEALEIAAAERGIPSIARHPISVSYKGQPLRKHYVADLLCHENIIVELKALDRLSSREQSQLLNYLKATGKPVRLLVNFGAQPGLEWKRMVLTARKWLSTEPSTRVSRFNPRGE